MNENILSQTVRMKYQEPAAETNFEEFRKVVESRRSVRVYEPTEVPENDVNLALDMALLAPNSSNLQPWKFYWVKSAPQKSLLVEACLSQQAAKTAPVLIVCVAEPDKWKKHSEQMLAFFDQQVSRGEEVPSIARKYYSKVTRLAYSLGPFGLFGVVKMALLTIVGLFRPVPRGPVRYSELREWAVKTTALGCENLMLAFRALGYDTCPMEGFDEVRVKKILGLGSRAHVVMVISAGKRASMGVYGPRVRFPRDQFITII